MEINYSSKNTTIENITVEPFGDYVFLYDLIVSVKYIEIPILVLYDLKLSNAISFFLEFGPSYSLALSDNSERNVIDRIEIPPEDIEYDYGAYNDPVMPNNLWGINFGIATKWENLMLDIRYVLYLDNLGTVDRVHPIDSNFRSIYAILTYYF